MDALIERWKRAGVRAQEERVRVLEIDGEYYATSSSQPLGAYTLRRMEDGWACACVANSEHGLPCKHLWALADMLGLDLLSDVRVSDDFLALKPTQTAA